MGLFSAAFLLSRRCEELECGDGLDRQLHEGAVAGGVTLVFYHDVERLAGRVRRLPRPCYGDSRRQRGLAAGGSARAELTFTTSPFDHTSVAHRGRSAWAPHASSSASSTARRNAASIWPRAIPYPAQDAGSARWTTLATLLVMKGSTVRIRASASSDLQEFLLSWQRLPTARGYVVVHRHRSRSVMGSSLARLI